jgi:hypothetical protein
MATRKQRKRVQKDRRHEQAWYQIDEFGNETEIEASERDDQPSTQKSDSKAKQPAKQRPSRATREPLAPSWRRALKRSGLIGAVVFVLFVILGSKGGKHNYALALIYALGYTALFVPFTYYLDRFAYNRWQRKTAEQPKKR